MAFDVTETKPTFAEQYADMDRLWHSMDDSHERYHLLDLMRAMKLGYLYGRAEMGTEITGILRK